jgi:two-component system sensor histidine kinase/response regulator
MPAQPAGASALGQCLGVDGCGGKPDAKEQDIAASLRHLSILLAEDNPMNQKLATRLLEKRGHSITTVANGREAVEALNLNVFDVVLMDVQMPEMAQMPEIDGWKATQAIRRREQDTGGDNRARHEGLPGSLLPGRYGRVSHQVLLARSALRSG